MILIVIGTRPEIIKMSPVIRECTHQGLEFSVLHTGQHYSYAMDKIFFEQLDLPSPDYQSGCRIRNPGCPDRRDSYGY